MYPSKDQQKAARRSTLGYDILDEVHELHWDPAGSMELGELYEPVSLCLVSRIPLFDILKVKELKLGERGTMTLQLCLLEHGVTSRTVLKVTRRRKKMAAVFD